VSFPAPDARTGGFQGNVKNQREPNLEYVTQFILLLAQVSEAKPGAPAQPEPQAPGLGAFLPAIVGAMVLYYFLIIRPERRKQSTHRSQLDQLKKNDRVVTIGGIYGVVMNVQPDADEVTLKIDETTNAKIRVTMGSIARIVGSESAGDKSS
jgi:preprotein translocase subunit YajC